MLASAKTKDFPSFILDDSSRELPPLNIEEQKWSLKLSISQLVIVWSIVTGVMLGIFLLGFYAGRDQGLKLSLEKNALDSVRLPVIEPDLKETPEGGYSLEFSPTKEIDSPKQTQEPIIPTIKEEPNPIEKSSNISETSAKKSILAESNVRETTKLATGWYVQVAAARTREEASVIISKLKDGNYSNILLEKAEISKRTYFRVVSGPYSDKNTAEKIKNQLGLSKIVSNEPYIKNIK